MDIETIIIKRRGAPNEVPSFNSIEELKAAQEAKRHQTGKFKQYPRDGCPELVEFEDEVAEWMGVRKGNLLAFGAGMLAVGFALEVNKITAGTRILRGFQHYSQAGKIISKDFGEDRGSSVSLVNPGSIADIEKKLKEKRPEIVFFETVTNGSEMAVLNVEDFLKLPILRDLDPVIILDNTLPTSTGLPLPKIMESSDRKIIGVESGTKYVSFNIELNGVVYTNNEELLQRLKERRQRWGSLLTLSAIEKIRKWMPESGEEYYLATKAFFQHTLRLAKACASCQNGNFAVVHPNLPDHSNSEYANSRAPEGISPVFFIIPTDFDEETPYRIGSQLLKHPTVWELGDKLGQSFGFDRTRILPDDNVPVVRVCGGLYFEDEQEALDKAFHEVLSSYQ